jgi:adenylate cyclase
MFGLAGMRARFRFRRFRTRLMVLLLGLLVAALGATYYLVSRANYANAMKHSEDNLALGARVYAEAVGQRIEYLEATANVMTTDYAIRQVLMQDKPDTRTLSSSLQSYTQRVNAPVIALFDTDGELLANSDVKMDNENRGPFAYLIRQATDRGDEEQHGFAYLNNKLHVLVVVPLYAPRPVIYKWFGLAFPIDGKFAAKIKDTTQLELTFVRTDDPARPQVLASTLPESDARIIARAAAESRRAPDRIRILDLPGERYVSLFKSEEMLGDDPVTVVLQRPLSAELAAARKLETSILGISLAALAAAAVVAFGIARGISRPVQQLAAHTRHVAAGDYSKRIDLSRGDELGQLATAFNDMTAGLAERDRVRDLLGKVVSPEIAAQLLTSGVQLGGEEREVTILFSDLRNFTSWSEKLAPTEVLTLLNRYLDRMSSIVERHGGVVDKYIGDAIMALFGAPISAPDDADRALAAAREMDAALVGLNRELLAEGKPPLAFGVGINTARVVAGNMGSKTRLNYTVIGDGVNLASRLEGLTKDPAYGTRIIVSEATLQAAHPPPSARALGVVQVKGKAEPVKIFAVNAKGESQPPHQV